MSTPKKSAFGAYVIVPSPLMTTAPLLPCVTEATNSGSPSGSVSGPLP